MHEGQVTPLRPEPAVGLGWTCYQWATLALLPIFAWLWIRDRRGRMTEEEQALAAPKSGAVMTSTRSTEG